MDYTQARFNMVEQQIRPWDVLNFDLLDALQDIPREQFVSTEQLSYAYADMSLRLPNGCAMLEPKIVARLTQGLALNPQDKVLEIGTGSGYATALLAKLSKQVITTDIDAEQQQRAQNVLTQLGYGNISYQQADGFADNPEAPFNAIYVGGATHQIPENLKQQLADGGRLVIIVGEFPVQRALLITRHGNKFSEKTLFDTFIPYLDSQLDPVKNQFHF